MQDNSIMQTNNTMNVCNPASDSTSVYPTLIPNTKIIYVNDKLDKLHMFVELDRATGYKSVSFMVEDENKDFTVPKSISRSKLVTSSKWANMFFNYSTDYDKNDIDRIKSAVMEHLQSITPVETGEAITLNEAYIEICRACYVCEYMTIENGMVYGDIPTREFSDMLSNLNTGLKRLEVLRYLKVMGLLVVDKNRSFDHQDNKNQQKVYRVRFPLTPNLTVDEVNRLCEDMVEGFVYGD